MLIKIIITLLIIIGASFYLRRGKSSSSKTAQAVTQHSSHPIFNKRVIYSFIMVCILSTAVLWGWGWYDDNQIVTVKISSPIEAMSSQYQVRKKDIHARKITTIEGIEIRLSNQERVTISASASTDK
ncbi:hypothetical protein [Shewanella sp. OMA3-2]|uniref:hypothetical protein n=1 Tax=Shewanella sp. OMA3-2 TaxID=2908650 RepID=UPI001F189EFE|nr:hypothetical protein [Shewanella sp. OMA3-2]UJF22828.1 hypothetical protein L0B17_05430 [Shewanella sp. OMA3-2]